ncbi:50S ribosomal protein L14 [Candidatus Bipolaricaulota bacterium]|nr:50S ribosomal protein L14 [Candidatus Bipolaricaulota bacterium]MBS3813815.1 50S ribosomal protein L14 [Candidatus Bipolaricaulota bacterium]MBS3824934.1 50S ribosomal protein L14 [Candidatus Bipolaricaulota bacterium]
MIQQETELKVADNSGAKRLRCINVLGQSNKNKGKIGDIVTASVKKRIPDSDLEKGEVVRAVIVRTKSNFRREDGSYIRFDDNAAVLVDERMEPVGTRIFGPVTRELREGDMLRIISLAPEVL